MYIIFSSTNDLFFSKTIASSLTSMNGSPVIFTPDQKNIVVCNSNFQSLHNQTAAPVMEEITPDQILDMPIVFADEPQEEVVEVKHSADNSSFFITNLNEFNERKMVVKEEPLDEDEHFDVLCPTISRTTAPERLKIKQVCTIISNNIIRLELKCSK